MKDINEIERQKNISDFQHSKTYTWTEVQQIVQDLLSKKGEEIVEALEKIYVPQCRCMCEESKIAGANNRAVGGAISIIKEHLKVN